MRNAGKAFFNEALSFLEHLANPKGRVYPHLVRVERIQIDRFGRRVIEAVGEDDHPERIFTDVDLQPGALYLMHPLTIPLRVDPILVPAGELPSAPPAVR